MSATVRIRVWDPCVRLCHWFMAGAVIGNLFLLEEGESAHRWLGYAAGGAVMMRLLWGLVGSRAAHLRGFFPSLPQVLVQLRELRAGRGADGPGHHPLGALLMLVMLSLILALGITGWLQGTDRFWGEEWLINLHARLALSLRIALSLHFTAALFLSQVYRSNLILAMITGIKHFPAPESSSSRPSASMTDTHQ